MRERLKSADIVLRGEYRALDTEFDESIFLPISSGSTLNMESCD